MYLTDATCIHIASIDSYSKNTWALSKSFTSMSIVYVQYIAQTM